MLLPAQGNATDDPIASLRQRKLIAEAMNYWLAADRPRAEATASAILEHRARLTEAGITIDSQILRLQRPAMTRYLVVEPLKLIPGLVPALAGLIHHIIPFAITRLLARFSKFPGRAWLATGRLLCSVPIYFIWYAVVWWALARSTKPWIAWTWTALMPFAGIIAWHYWQHATELLRLWRQEVRMFLRPNTLKGLRSEQSELRAKLHSLAEDYRKRPKSSETSSVA